MASLPEWGEWESAVRGWLRDPVVHLVQRGLVNPATGEPGKFKKCMEAGGRRRAGGRSRELVGSRQNSAPTSCTWYCACVYRTIGGRGGPGAMRQ